MGDLPPDHIASGQHAGDDFAGDNVLLVPWQSLSDEALRGVLEEYITRDGTDYGATELTLETRLQRAQHQLQNGEVLLAFDTAEQSCHIISREQARELSVT